MTVQVLENLLCHLARDDKGTRVSSIIVRQNGLGMAMDR
ncbi:MAG: hypothetical protein ACI91T_002938 [Natronomonas sp.]